MWGRMGPRLNLFSVHDADLGPTVFQPIILSLFSAERAPSRHLLEHIIKQVRILGGVLTISPTIRGQKDGALALPLRGWPSSAAPSGLAGWVRVARRRSNPGQSWPIRTGTGRSFITPTSMGQVPGAAEMVTRRAGTWRVSPWTQVIGRNVL